MRANRSVPLLMLFVLAGSLAPILATAQMPAVLPLRERGPIYDRWLKDRLNTVLPEIMRRQGIDMWLVICREYEEDPVYLSLVPLDSFSARRLSMLVFYDRGKEGLEKFTVGRYGIGDLYKAVWDPDKIGQWERLAQVVKERNPKRIGIDESEVFAFGDGLSASNKAALIKAMGATAVRYHADKGTFVSDDKGGIKLSAGGHAFFALRQGKFDPAVSAAYSVLITSGVADPLVCKNKDLIAKIA